MQDGGKIPSTLSSFLYDQPLFRADMKDRGVGEDQNPMYAAAEPCRKL